MKLVFEGSVAEFIAMKKSFRDFLCEIIGCGKHKQKVIFGWSVEQPKEKTKGTTMPLELTVTNEQQVKVHLNPVTEAGKPTTLDGAPTWSVVSGPATVVAAADGLSADLVSSDTDLSDTIFKVEGDADLGSGVESIADTITLHCLHANAKSLGLTADAPVLKPTT